LRFWLNRGVDGFRFDAVGNLVENGPNAWEIQSENYAIMGDIRSMLDTYAQRFMVCEVPADPIGLSLNSACRSAFAFGHHKDIVDAARGSASAIQSVANYFKTAPTTIATMASNHDTFAGDRLYDQVGGNLAQYRLAAATYLLQPGVPFIYYGEEIGMSGNPGLAGDRKLRTPMSWTESTSNAGFTTGTPFRALSGNVASYNVATQQRDPDSLSNFYKTLIALRRTLPSLAAAGYVNANDSGSAMTFQRVLGNERAVVAINYGSSPATIAVGGLPPGAVLNAGYPAGAGSVTASGSGIVRASLPAQSFSVYWNRS
jgi:glycosidase